MFGVPFTVGIMFFGKVKAVPGLFYIATKFFHFCFIPLFPIGSYIVLSNSERIESFLDPWAIPTSPSELAVGGHTKTSILVHQVPFDSLSALMAWLRAVLILALIFCTFTLITEVEHHVRAIILIIALIILAVIACSYRFTLATKEQALVLGRRAGFSEDMLLDALRSRSQFFLFRPRLVYKHCQTCGQINRLSLRRGAKGVYRCGHCGAGIRLRKGKISSDTAALVILFLLVLIFAIYRMRNHF